MIRNLQNKTVSDLYELIGDKHSSDFTILCRGHRFRVHSYVLRAKSEHFCAILDNPIFSESQSKVLNLTQGVRAVGSEPKLQDSDNPYLIYAFLVLLYGGPCKPYQECIKALTGATDPYTLKGLPTDDNFIYHRRLSQLADYFRVKGLEEVIVPSVFGHEKLDASVVDCSPRYKEVLCENITVLIRNTLRSQSHKARRHIAHFLVDNWEYLPNTPGSMQLLMEIPRLIAETSSH